MHNRTTWTLETDVKVKHIEQNTDESNGTEEENRTEQNRTEQEKIRSEKERELPGRWR